MMKKYWRKMMALTCAAAMLFTMAGCGNAEGTTGGEYDKVFPMDIYAEYLIKAIIAGDIDKQEQLGIYEVSPEDFALAEFVDSSKLELQHIVRQGLDILRKENS